MSSAVSTTVRMRILPPHLRQTVAGGLRALLDAILARLFA